MAMTFFEKELKKLVDQGLPLTDTAFEDAPVMERLRGIFGPGWSLFLQSTRISTLP